MITIIGRPRNCELSQDRNGIKIFLEVSPIIFSDMLDSLSDLRQPPANVTDRTVVRCRLDFAEADADAYASLELLELKEVIATDLKRWYPASKRW